MLYFNDKSLINILDEINTNNLFVIRDILNEKGIELGSIRELENENIEIILNNDYLLLGPLGGIAETKGKYDKYNCFDRDLDEHDSVLKEDIKYITSGKIPIINLGN